MKYVLVPIGTFVVIRSSTCVMIVHLLMKQFSVLLVHVFGNSNPLSHTRVGAVAPPTGYVRPAQGQLYSLLHTQVARIKHFGIALDNTRAAPVTTH